jgi:hypothetical protein
MGTFFSNTVWYVALAATSAAALAVIFAKAANRKRTLAFYFAVLGLTYWIEVSLVLIFEAYAYHPMLVGDVFFDSVLGNVFSQVSVSSSAVLICVLGLSNKWVLGFAAAYFLIDLLFSSLGIYVHYWYRSVYTLAGFLIYALAVRYWYNKIFDSPTNRIFYPTLYFASYAVTGNIFGTAYKLFGVRIFQSEFFADPSRNHTATSLIYGPLLVIVCIALYKWNARRLLKGFVFALLLVCQYGLVMSGVMVIKPGWWPFILPLDLAGYFGFTAFMDTSLRTVRIR